MAMIVEGACLQVDFFAIYFYQTVPDLKINPRKVYLSQNFPVTTMCTDSVFKKIKCINGVKLESKSITSII